MSINFWKKILDRWLLSTIARDLGTLYLLFGTFSGVLGTIYSFFIRLELAHPSNTFFMGNHHLFNVIGTSHGIIMIFFMLMPILFCGFGNWIIPWWIGVKNMAFPRLNIISFWLLPPAFSLLLYSNISDIYTCTTRTVHPLLSVYLPQSHLSADYVLLSLCLICISYTLSAINFIVTIIFYREHTMWWDHQFSAYIWAVFFISVVLIVSVPIVCGRSLAVIDYLHEYHFPCSPHSTILVQNLFWLFAYPEAFILILPVFGLVAEVIASYCKRRIAPKLLAMQLFMMCLSGFTIWFCMNILPFFDFWNFIPYDLAVFYPEYIRLISLNSCTVLFFWIWLILVSRLRREVLTTPVYFAFGFIFFFFVGGGFAVLFSILDVQDGGTDYSFLSSYGVVWYSHFVLSMGVVFGMFSGFYYWVYWITGLAYIEKYGRIHFWLLFIGANITFIPMFFLAWFRMPRLVPFFSPDSLISFLHLVPFFGCCICIVATLWFLYVVFDMLWNKHKYTKIGSY